MRSHIAQPGHPTNRNLRRGCQENSRVITNGLNSPRGAASKSKKRLEQTWESDSMIIALNSQLAAKVKAHFLPKEGRWYSLS